MEGQKEGVPRIRPPAIGTHTCRSECCAIRGIPALGGMKRVRKKSEQTTTSSVGPSFILCLSCSERQNGNTKRLEKECHIGQCSVGRLRMLPHLCTSNGPTAGFQCFSKVLVRERVSERQCEMYYNTVTWQIRPWALTNPARTVFSPYSSVFCFAITMGLRYYFVNFVFTSCHWRLFLPIRPLASLDE
jgi:hypothetical protein